MEIKNNGEYNFLYYSIDEWDEQKFQRITNIRRNFSIFPDHPVRLAEKGVVNSLETRTFVCYIRLKPGSVAETNMRRSPQAVGGFRVETLKERIQKEGIVVSEQVLNLDSLLNHQVDPRLTMEMGREFAARFADDNITKVLTIESSGIPVAFATALELDVPLVFARRKKTLATDEDCWSERVPSFTKGMVTDIVVSSRFLGREDRLLIIDDIIANGDAVRGLITIVERSGAELAGLGVVVEKAFQAGGRSHRERGIRVEALVRIQSLKNNTITFL